MNKVLRIRRLVPADATAWQALRLAALRESPTTFSSSYEEERDTPLATIESHLAPDSGRNRFGAFDGADLVGMVGVGRETATKIRHKGFIGGMYVAPSHRGKGIGRKLMAQALGFAESMQGLRQIALVVTAGNAAAFSLYKSLGFEVYGQEPTALFVDGVFYDDVHMVRQVAACDRIELINRYLAAYNAFDVDSMLATLSPAILFENHSGDQLTAATSGIDEFRQLAEQSKRLFSEREQRITALERSDGSITASIAYRGLLAADIPNGPCAGSILNLLGSTEFSFSGGRISKIVDRS